MSRSSARPQPVSAPGSAEACRTPAQSVVLVGLMGAGKTTIGRKLAARLGLRFHDADLEIERAAGRSISEMWTLWGEAAFREGERRVISRLLQGGPIVLASGGGAFMDAATRAAIRERAVSVWLRCPLETLVRRTSGRTHRPLLAAGTPRETLGGLMRVRHPVYAEADLVIDCGDDSAEHTTRMVQEALAAHRSPEPLAERLPVRLPSCAYDILIGPGLLARAGSVLAPVLPARHAMIVTDTIVAELHLPSLCTAFDAAGITHEAVVMPPGEASKSLDGFARLTARLLEAGIERQHAVVALGGGVIGDLAGFAAATLLRGLDFVQIPTTLLAQVDSSVGGKTGVNTPFGKNLIGAFHQPVAVLADTAILATLPARELRAGYAEILKAALIGDPELFAWCIEHGAAIVSGDASLQAQAVARACRFKAQVVAADERERQPEDGRALLNLGHTFAHALEAELGYDGRLLHGEAVAVGLVLAAELSARLGHCEAELASDIASHLGAIGMISRLAELARNLSLTLSAPALLAHMGRDKKIRQGRLSMVLLRGVGEAFTSRAVTGQAVRDLLVAEGCAIEG